MKELLLKRLYLGRTEVSLECRPKDRFPSPTLTSVQEFVRLFAPVSSHCNNILCCGQLAHPRVPFHSYLLQSVNVDDEMGHIAMVDVSAIQLVRRKARCGGA